MILIWPGGCIIKEGASAPFLFRSDIENNDDHN